jgi:dUTP pyrophosphatase
MELYLIPKEDDSHKVLLNLYNDKIQSHNKSIWNHYEWDEYADSGFDLLIPPCPNKDENMNWVIPANSTVKIPLGIKLVRTDKEYHMPMGSQNPKHLEEDRTLPYTVYPRSSISKTSVRLANNVGIIDAGYRGELMVVFDNIKNESYEIQPYTRLVQACKPDLSPFSVKIVDEDFSETVRGSGGFGSTGL